MKLQSIQIRVFEKGDRVFTPEGEGVVLKTEEDITDLRIRQDIQILLDEPTSRFSNGKAELPAECVDLIEEENKK